MTKAARMAQEKNSRWAEVSHERKKKAGMVGFPPGCCGLGLHCRKPQMRPVYSGRVKMVCCRHPALWLLWMMLTSQVQVPGPGARDREVLRYPRVCK
jgi:hypothetical protein